MSVIRVALALFVAASPAAGSWTRLPAAPIAPNDVALTSVWTGKELLVVGRRVARASDGAVLARRDVAAAYDPARKSWRALPSPPSSTSFLTYSSAWTGKKVLVWGQGIRVAFDPATNRWRRLPFSPLLRIHDGFGLVAWTGRELIGWGGGCCGDAFSDGVAYSPARNRWRALPRSPLAGSQHPVGAWTGRELLVVVGRLDPDGKPWPARLARAAAYDPKTNTWRRIAPIPSDRNDAGAVWDGRELLVIGGAARTGFAYNPATNRWRRLPPLPRGRVSPVAVWTGTRVLLWEGSAFAYDPKANSWTTLPRAPLTARLPPTAVWTGHSLLLWRGEGAAFTPRR
jgi:hypothetical protein